MLTNTFPICMLNVCSIVNEGTMQAMIAECQACRVAYQSPLPSPEASAAYMNWRWQSSDAYVANKRNQRRRALFQLSIISEQFSHPGRLLDFGSGAGSFEFNAITLWDVIEHLPDPVSTLSQLRGRLVPGGQIVLETGNYESWLRLAEKERWGLYLFDHQFYFSPTSLRITLEKAGYSGFQLLRCNRTNPWSLRFISRRPDLIFSSWKYWWAAKKRWPDHGNIHIMLAAAKRPVD